MIKKDQFQDIHLVLQCKFSLALIPSLYVEIQNIQKSCIYNHDEKIINFNIYTWSYNTGVV